MLSTFPITINPSTYPAFAVEPKSGAERAVADARNRSIPYCLWLGGVLGDSEKDSLVFQSCHRAHPDFTKRGELGHIRKNVLVVDPSDRSLADLGRTASLGNVAKDPLTTNSGNSEQLIFLVRSIQRHLTSCMVVQRRRRRRGDLRCELIPEPPDKIQYCQETNYQAHEEGDGGQNKRYRIRMPEVRDNDSCTGP